MSKEEEKPIADPEVGSTEQLISSAKKKYQALPWYLTPIFLLSWVILFFAVLRPIYMRLPAAYSIADEAQYPGQFIGERAQKNLLDYDKIGVKLIGSDGNENQTVALILREINKIKEEMNKNLYELDVEVQVAKGCFTNKNLNKFYNDLQNVIVKFSYKTSTSENALLINSHFDSKPMSPGTGDDGSMVVVHLEVLRVLATSNVAFEHPIIFLFNGGEEAGLLGSHAFVTQHKWAKQVKAVLNYDCSGSGHKEVLFQHSPRNSWLMKYYKDHVRHPYANVIAEEIFQSGSLPSDTDFSVFSKVAKYPGLDFAFIYNGYVYHTEFDAYNVIPRESLQNAGDNVLSLVKALANAPELSKDSSDPMDTGTIFFDFMGLHLIVYSNNTGKVINIVCAVCTFIFVIIGLWQTSLFENHNSRQVICTFLTTFFLQLLGIVLSIVVPVLLAVIMDEVKFTMTWFTSKWLILGLYMVPAVIGLSLPTILYIKNQKPNDLAVSSHTHLVLYAHLLIMGIILLALALFNIKSAFLVLLPTAFYLLSNVINLVLAHLKSYESTFYWSFIICLGQVLPFLQLFTAYHNLIIGIIPMTGRLGSGMNPDLIIAGSAAIFIVLGLGFVLPLLNLFRRPKTTLFLLVIASAVFFGIACFTMIGFPYRPATNVKRIEFQAARRIFYNFDGTVRLDENGFFFLFDDRRKVQEFPQLVDIDKMKGVQSDCANYVACGLPLYDFHWYGSRKRVAYLPVEQNFIMPDLYSLNLNERSVYKENSTVKYSFTAKGPNQMGFFIKALPGVKVTQVSVSTSQIEELNGYYHIIYSCGKTCDDVNLNIEVEAKPENLNKPLIEFAVAAFYIDLKYERDPVLTSFTKKFPSFTFVLSYPSLYEHHLY